MVLLRTEKKSRSRSSDSQSPLVDGGKWEVKSGRSLLCVYTLLLLALAARGNNNQQPTVAGAVFSLRNIRTPHYSPPSVLSSVCLLLSLRRRKKLLPLSYSSSSDGRPRNWVKGGTSPTLPPSHSQLLDQLIAIFATHLLTISYNGRVTLLFGREKKSLFFLPPPSPCSPLDARGRFMAKHQHLSKVIPQN